MLSCYCNIKESQDKNWTCPSSIPPWKCPHNILNKNKTFFQDKKTAKYLKKHNIAMGIILLFTPLFPLSVYFFASAVTIKSGNRNNFRKIL